jgi:acetylornithine deacetylase/succinyl-diaminopimelate desuccinylase-like protein
MLRGVGLDVTVDTHFPGGANVIGRWRGSGSDPTLSFVGHLDTIHAPHAPPRLTDNAVHGRGADDMKGAMASVV